MTLLYCLQWQKSERMIQHMVDTTITTEAIYIAFCEYIVTDLIFTKC